ELVFHGDTVRHPGQRGAARSRVVKRWSVRLRAAVGTEAVGLHLGVDRSAADPQPARRQRGVAIATQRRDQRRALDGAHRAIGEILEAFAVAESIEIDRRQLDAVVAGLRATTGVRPVDAQHVEVMRPDGLAVAEDRGARQYVLELADVARPAVRL